MAMDWRSQSLLRSPFVRSRTGEAHDAKLGARLSRWMLKANTAGISRAPKRRHAYGAHGSRGTGLVGFQHGKIRLFSGPGYEQDPGSWMLHRARRSDPNESALFQEPLNSNANPASIRCSRLAWSLARLSPSTGSINISPRARPPRPSENRLS